MLMVNDFDFIIAAISNTLEDILQRNEAKEETMYEIIEAQLRGVQQALHSSCAVSTSPPPSEEIELGDELSQLCKIVDATKTHLRRVGKKKNRPQWP
jgi:hypothetical protein